LEHETEKQKVMASIHSRLVKNEVVDWIYVQNFGGKVGLGNKYVKLMKDKMKDNTQLGPEGRMEHLVDAWVWSVSSAAGNPAMLMSRAVRISVLNSCCLLQSISK
jgi:hypothetical protein